MKTNVRTWAGNRFADSSVGCSPCYQCADREIGCAGKCERYATWKEDRLAAKRKFWEQESGEKLVTDYKFQSRAANEKRMNRKGRW